MSISIYLNRIAAIFLFLVLSTVGVAHAIINGERDGDAHPYVALIVFGQQTADGFFIPQWWCSGSLIAPTVILTAGHCTSDYMTGAYPTVALAWVEEQPSWGNWVPGTDPSCEDKYGFPCTGYAAASTGMIHTHPDFTAVNTEPPYGGNYYRDVGVVVLDDTGIDVGRYAQLPEPRQVDALANKTNIDIVGFGNRYQAQIPGNLLPPPPPPPSTRWTAAYWRYQAQSQIISGEFSWSADKIRVTQNPGGGTGGSTKGDSGGPDLLADTDTVLAIHSYAININRGGVSYSSRVDIPDVLDWIEYFLPPSI